MPYKDPEADKAYKLAYNRRYYAANRDKILLQKRDYTAAHTAEKRVYNTQYRAEHYEEHLANERARYAANPDKILARHKGTRATDPDRRRQIERDSKAAHPETTRINNLRRKQRITGAVRNDLTPAQWREIKDAYGHCCVYCGRTMERLTPDHVTPYAHNGANTLWNVVPACLPCNKKKGSRPPSKPVQLLLLTIAPAKKQRS